MPTSPLAPTTPQFPVELSEAELLQLATYTTAPETHSPQYAYFDAEALRAQQGWRSLFRVSTKLLVFVSISSSVTGLGPWLVANRWLSTHQTRLLDGIGVSLTLLGLALEIGLQVYWRRQLRPWVTARYHAEALRGMVWRYLLELPLVGYIVQEPLGATDQQEWTRIMQHLAATEGGVASLPSEVPIELVAWRQRLAGLPPAAQLQSYVQARLVTQQQYFTKRAAEMTATARRWNYIGYGLLGLALAWNGVRLLAIVQSWPLAMAFFNFNFSLVIIGGVTLVRTYIETEDLDPLAARYRRMASELQEHQNSLPSAPVSVTALRQFVFATEQLLHNETADWTGRRSGS